MTVKDFEAAVRRLCDEKGVSLACEYREDAGAIYDFGFRPDPEENQIGFAVSCGVQVIDGRITCPEAIYLAGKLAGVCENFDPEIEAMAILRYTTPEATTMREALDAAEKIWQMMLPFSVDLLHLVQELASELIEPDVP